MVSDIYKDLSPTKNADCLGTLTHREYFEMYDSLLTKSQEIGTALDDSEVNDYAASFMKRRIRFNELILNKDEEIERCKKFGLDPYETDTWVNLSCGECLAGNCVIDDDHPDPLASTMTESFLKLHSSMSRLIMYRPYMALDKLREFTNEPITDKTVKLWAVMLMTHERRHSEQSYRMIEKCNRWISYVMKQNIDYRMKRDSDKRFDVAEEDANYARLKAGAEYLEILKR